MAFTSTQLAALEAAYAEGVLSVRYADKTITYRSRAEMRQIMDEMRRQLASPKRKPFTLAAYRGGL